MGSLLAGESVGEGGSERDEGDRRDGVFEANDAAEEGGELGHDSRDHADEGERRDEGGPAIAHAGRRYTGEKQLPADGREMKECLDCGHVVDVAFLVDLRGQNNSLLELRGPCFIFVLLKHLQHVLDAFNLREQLVVAHDFDERNVLLRDFHAPFRVKNAHCENIRAFLDLRRFFR